MRCLLFCVIALLSSAMGSAIGDEIPTEEKVIDYLSMKKNVLVLSKALFDGFISSNNYVLVKFYAPWCQHSLFMEPQYVKAATKLLEEESPIKLAKVDATQEQELAETYGVRGYPTLKFFKNGSPIDYLGGRQAEEIVAWLKKKTGPPEIEVTSAEQAAELKKDNNVVVFGFFANKESEKAKCFLTVADQVEDQVFAGVSDEKLIKELGAEAEDVIIYRNFEEPSLKYDGTVFDQEVFKKWVFVNSMPSIVEFSYKSAYKWFRGPVKYHLYLFLSKKKGHFEKYLDAQRPVAKNYRDRIMFVALDTDEYDHQRFLEIFDIKKNEVPSARLGAFEQDMTNQVKYKPASDELSPNAVEEFIQSFFDGKLKQHLLSEELPSDWNAQPVKVLVATNFDEVVFDTNKKVLVEFHTPRCGPYCKELAPIYNKLAEHFEKDADVVIAKIDATANELEHTKITSFPTIKLYLKDNQVRDYNGERTLAGLTKFVETEGEGAEPTVTEEEDEEEQPARDEL